MLAESVEAIPEWLAALLELVWLCWWVYIISARLHDQWLPWWIAWMLLLLWILAWFWKSLNTIVTFVSLFFWIGLLFAKWVEEDNEYWPNPYVKEWKSIDNIKNVEDDEKRVKLEEKNTEKENKKVVKSKYKTAKWEKNK
jgi:hypothetical protein